MNGSGPRGSHWACRLVLVVMSLGCALSLAVAQQTGAPKKPDPPVLIGPCRITLTGGKTLEAIAVFREPGRVRVVLEDDTEIVFDPAKVVSVVALADLPDTPPPAAKPAPKGTAAAGKKGGKPTSPARVHAEPAGNGATTSTKKRPSAAKPADAADEPENESATGAATGDASAAKAKEEREREVEELAGMLQSAIANAAFEGHGTGGPDDGASGEGDDSEGKAGKDATLAPAASPGTEGGAGEAGGADGKKTYKPKPEDFDATRSVNKAGFRFLGPKGKLPETPPQIDFPKPSAPVTSMGFGRDTWRPSSGFGSNTATWSKPLDPATSFSNRLSGLDPPITSFGPSWWGPTPTKWPTSIFPAYWQPRDGFAKAQEQKAPPASRSPSSESGK